MFTKLTTAVTSIGFTFARRPLHVSAINFAVPLRKKKTINPLTTKKQFDRRVRRLEREIARLSSLKATLKPILELKLSPQVIKELDERHRKESDEPAQTLLKSYLKLWSVYKSLESQNELQQIETVAKAQERTLKLLRDEYPQLYQKAIELDPQLIPYKVENVKKETPPNLEYKCPDGKSTDITKEWKL